MQAIVYDTAWHAGLKEVPDITPPEVDEVVVAVRATGICGTDIGIISGEYHASPGVILGHETAGDVVAVGPLAAGRFTIGDRVVIDPTYFCGMCRMCRTNRQNHCLRKGQTETGVSRDGTFAPFHKTTAGFLHKIPSHVSYAAASLTEPLSCAVTGARQLKIHLGLRVVVLGGGPMGVLYCTALTALGLGGYLVEHAPARAARCSGVLDKRWKITDRLETVLAAYGGDEDRPLDIVVDTTGRMTQAIMPHLARGGQLLTIGLKRNAATLEIGEFADRSLALLGSIDSLANSFTEALSLIVSGQVAAEKIVSHQIGLDQFDDGLALLGCDTRRQLMGRPGDAMKVVVMP